MKEQLAALIFSIQFLTRVPLRYHVDATTISVRTSLFCFPMVGFFIGAVLFIVWYLLSMLTHFNAFTIAVIIVTIETIITGAFHLDGLADTFDALLSSGTTPEQKLAIMKDSRIGVMGAVALSLSILLKIVFIGELIGHNLSQALLVYSLVGRWTLVLFLFISPYLRASGTGNFLAQSIDRKTVISASLWLIPCLLVPSFLFAFLVLLAALLLYRSYIHKNIGGITGDVLGSASVIAEIVILFSIAVFNR
jgi:adenosylcobinamide-GDP ribazoletransferase